DASRQVNPPGASIVLSQAQVWKGLQMKARDPINFLAEAESCDITDDHGDNFTRQVLFQGVSKPITQQVQEYSGAAIDFHSPSTKTRVMNTLSFDESDRMVLTYTFIGGIPGYKPVGVSDLRTLNKKSRFTRRSDTREDSGVSQGRQCSVELDICETM
ncbi:DUF1857 family protein, partial [Pectobacterium polaris]|nr:DUF1857 family protein [Pectobacterium polaris]